MDLNGKLHFGINEGLTLRQIYQGTSKINDKQLKNFLVKCLDSELVPKPNEFSICELIIGEKDIEIIPDIFDTNKLHTKNNQIYLGDLSEKIEIYFNHFFKPNWFGVIQNLQEFNSGQYIIGGNPEYILWCINEAKNFNIDLFTLRQLEKLKVFRFKGIKVEMIALNQYKYRPIIEEEYYRFNFQLLSFSLNNENLNYDCEFPF